MSKFSYAEFSRTTPFEESLSIARHPRIARNYINAAIDKLAQHMELPDRRPNVSLTSFSQHVAPNTGTGNLLQWMLTHSGLIENTHGVGITRITDARLTDLGAETLLAEYRTVKGKPEGVVDEAIRIEREAAAIRIESLLEQNTRLQQEVGRLRDIGSVAITAEYIHLHGDNEASDI